MATINANRYDTTEYDATYRVRSDYGANPWVVYLGSNEIGRARTRGDADLIIEVHKLDKRIVAMAAVEHHVATNQGTYGDNEACRKVGCADPQFANYDRYETVGGTVRERGADRDVAPGRIRSLNRPALTADRKELKQLKSEAAKLRKQIG